MFSNSQKKLLQKYDLDSQINSIFGLKNLDLCNFNWNNLDKNQKMELKTELENFLKNAFEKQKLQKTFEGKMLKTQINQSVKKPSNSDIFSNTIPNRLNSNKTLQKPNSTLTQNSFQNQKLNSQNQIPKNEIEKLETTEIENRNLFDDNYWIDFILPRIEHPQFTKPQIWKNCAVPSVLLGGNHLAIQKWRQFGWKKIVKN